MQRFPPSPAGSARARLRAGGGKQELVELLLAAVAIVLTVAILLSELSILATSRPAGGRRPPRAASTATSGTSSPRPPVLRATGNLLDDPSFEAGLGRWQASDGAHLTRVSGGRSGSWAASLASGISTSPSMAIHNVRRCQTGKAYAVTVWLRASKPGALIRIGLVEESHGRRYAADTAGAVLGGQRWEPLEVIHVTHKSGAALAIEVAVELPADVTVFVDDLELRVTKASSKP